MMIKKVLIPAAGLGTRFLPATKALPKEMFPIIDIPTIQYIVEEAIKSGIEEVGIIISLAKPSIEKHFSIDEELEKRLIEVGKVEEAKMIREIANMAKVKFILQPQPRGLGHAILCAKEFINGEDFAIMLGDDLIVNYQGEPVLKQLINVYEETNKTVLGVQEVSIEDVSKYGIVSPEEEKGRIIKVDHMVEKPKKEEAPSRYAVLGRYVMKNRIFDFLEKVKENGHGEIGLTEAIDMEMKEDAVYAYNFEGVRYDIGNKFGYIKAIIDFALHRDDLKEKVLSYIKEIAE